VTARHYGGAGLTIVADRFIPGFAAASARTADLTIYTGRPPLFAAAPHVAVYNSDAVGGGAPQVIVSRSRHGYRFEYEDGTSVWIDAAAERVWMTWNTTFEDACTYLIGPIMAFVLRLRGEVALHASAVKIGELAVALIGPHGSGKSTTAAALARAGCAVITDDLLRLTPEAVGWRAYPYGNMLRLWPASAALLYGDPERLPRITASWDKRGLTLGRYRGAVPAGAPVPVRTLIFLSRSAYVDAGCEARPVNGSDAILRLIANSAAGHLLDAPARAQEFRAVARLANDVPCFAIDRGHGPDALDAVVRHLLA
jgi:hypothetical protein